MPNIASLRAQQRTFAREFNAELSHRLMLVCGERSYRELSELTGFTHETIRRYVLGLVSPSALSLTVLCSSFGYSPDWLLLGKGPSNPRRPKRRKT
jgi:transcriptional regulator with XRE-family HTH domain